MVIGATGLDDNIYKFLQVSGDNPNRYLLQICLPIPYMVTVNIAVRDCHLLVAVFSLLDGGASTLGNRVTVSWTTEMPHYFKDSEYNM